MKRSRAVYEQRFHVRYTEIAIGYPEGSVSIACSNLSKSCMQKLMNELVYDGYSSTGSVQENTIYLYEPDPMMCLPDSLKEMIQAKMESMNYEVTFLF